MDRLLSADEICQTCPAVGMRTTEHKHLRCHPDKCLVHPDIIPTIKAQDLKTSQWWVDRIERRVIDKCLSLGIDPEHCLICEKAGACYIESWQSLKKEIGL
jgi:hypothetical protein